MINANKAIQFRNAVATLRYIADLGKVLAADNSAMPDGKGTVAGIYAQAVADLEIPYLKFLDTVPAEVLKAIAVKSALPATTVLPTDSALPAQKPRKEADRVLKVGEILAVRKNTFEEVMQIGDFAISTDRKTIAMFLPDDKFSPRGLPIHETANDPDAKGWLFTGPDEAPTLAPSIDAMDQPIGDQKGASLYHGFLRNGVFTRNLNLPAEATKAPAVAPTITQDAPQTLKETITPAPHNGPRRAFDQPGMMA